VFNSGYRPLYTKNVLNTLYLPHGWTNEYRYRYAGASSNIEPATYSSLAAIQRGTECVVIFIDRFANTGYRYHPLRLGEYLQHRIENEYVYFRIRVRDFIYPIDTNVFNDSIVQALGTQGLPILTNHDPENAHDGYYALQSDSIFSSRDAFHIGDLAWGDAVQNLSTTRALATNAAQAPVFLRLQIVESGKERRYEPRSKGVSALYEFKKNRSYDAVLTYRYPRQRLDHTSRAGFQLKLGENLRPNEASVSVDSHANSVEVRFVSKRYVDDDTGNIQLEPKVEASQPELLLPNSSLTYQITESKGFWLQLTVALLLLSIVGAVLGLDFSKIQPLTAANLLSAARPKLFLGAIQTAILFWVFRLIGKKIF
jgi:hypothetical protein